MSYAGTQLSPAPPFINYLEKEMRERERERETRKAKESESKEQKQRGLEDTLQNYTWGKSHTDLVRMN